MMDHSDTRTILLGLADNPTGDNRSEAIKVVMAQRSESRQVVVPFPAGREVILRVPADRFTAEDWKYMLRVFEAMRPGLLTDGDDVVAAAVEEREQ